MTEDQIQRRMIEQFGVRVQPHMARYVQSQLASGTASGDGTIPVIGGDARTGVAVRKLVALAALQRAGASAAASEPAS